MPLTTRPLSDFLPMVLPYAVGCPASVAEANLRLAAIEYCERTRCWRSVLTQTFAAQGEAITVAPAYAAIHEIETAFFGTENIPLKPTQFSSVDPEDIDAADGALGQPEYITQVSSDTITVIPFQTGDIRLTLFLKPRSGTEYGTNPLAPLQDAYNVVPDFLFVQHAETIACGALARILKLPKQEFTDPKFSAYYEAKFDDRTDAKFSSNIRGQHRAPRRTRLNLF